MRQKDSVYSKRYDEKRKAQRIVLNFYADDEQERILIEKIKELQAQKQLKSVVKQLLIDYFDKPPT